LDVLWGILERFKQPLKMLQLIEAPLALLPLLIKASQALTELLVSVRLVSDGRNSNRRKCECIAGSLYILIFVCFMIFQLDRQFCDVSSSCWSASRYTLCRVGLVSHLPG
jgi:hypothetical protein